MAPFRKVDQWNMGLSFSAPLAAAGAALLAFFCAFTTYSQKHAGDEHVSQYYMWYIHVAVMIFVGFGFLMTFLRRYSYSAVALNFILSVLTMLVFLLVGGAVQQLWMAEEWPASGKVELDLPLLIDAAFCAGATMIAFGAVLGTATPGQLVWMILLEVPIYAINQKLVFHVFQALDIGGSMTIHAFGAYFGLAVSMILSPKGSGSSHPKNSSDYSSDMTAMIGTIALFIFWPSYNGALASNPELADQPFNQTQFYCVLNTVVALLGSVLSAFAASAALEGKLNMVHIQNATLAGGVAMGAAADLQVAPGGALAIGLIAGVLSTAGYQYLGPALERKIGLRDTCGVHNLHGLPGILGGLAATVASVVTASKSGHVMHHGSRAWAYQLAGLGTSLGMALAGGALTGLFMVYINPAKQNLPAGMMYEDAVFWTAEQEEDVFADISVKDSSQNPSRRLQLPITG